MPGRDKDTRCSTESHSSESSKASGAGKNHTPICILPLSYHRKLRWFKWSITHDNRPVRLPERLVTQDNTPVRLPECLSDWAYKIMRHPVPLIGKEWGIVSQWSVSS